jgi:hypothetical protein
VETILLIKALAATLFCSSFSSGSHMLIVKMEQ